MSIQNPKSITTVSRPTRGSSPTLLIGPKRQFRVSQRKLSASVRDALTAAQTSTIATKLTSNQTETGRGLVPLADHAKVHTKAMNASTATAERQNAKRCKLT
ncbi:MAG: hypothetical protein H7143_11820 [Pseudorhodobacter sp.]|nr:hypothetical protein [Rhizobacter sp.]